METNGTSTIYISEEEKIQTGKRAKRTLLWFGIISMTMLFAGLTSAYIVRQGEGKWVQFELPNLFLVSTVVILVSSLAMVWAVKSVKKNNSGSAKIALTLTFLLGCTFVVTQYMAWGDLVSQGIYFSGRIMDIEVPHTYVPAGTESEMDSAEAGNVAASFLYVLTGLHVVHLIGGMLALFVVTIKAFAGRYTQSNHNGLILCSIYWHFLDGLWIYLFLFLNFIR